MDKILKILKILADGNRLRILRAVNQAELSVAEIATSLKIPQSSVSRHLKPLKEIELINNRRDGTTVFYHKGNLFDDKYLKPLLTQKLEELSFAKEDSLSIDKVLEIRNKKTLNFFNKIAGKYNSLTEPGGGWDALVAALASGFSELNIADLGCGEGDLSLMLGRYAKKITCIDQSQKMLELVKDKSEKIGIRNKIIFIKEDLDKIKLEKNIYDVIFISQSLHHVENPEKIIKISGNSLKKGGKLIILDLIKHNHEWVREQWADRWLGFSRDEINKWINNSNLRCISFQTLQGATPDFQVLISINLKE